MIKNNIGISCTQYSQKDHIRKISKKGKKKKIVLSTYTGDKKRNMAVKFPVCTKQNSIRF